MVSAFFIFSRIWQSGVKIKLMNGSVHVIDQYPAAWLRGLSRGEEIACEIRLRIVTGAIAPGEVLSENRIAGDYGSSRSPVRDAFKLLAGEGLIRPERMGAVVLGLGLQDVEELYDVRHLIERFVQLRVSRFETGALLKRLRHIVDKMELAVRHRDIAEFAWHDMSFHDAIVAEARHARMLHLWKSIRNVVMTVMLVTTEDVFARTDEAIEAVVNKHRLIIHALESKDGSRIEEVVRGYFADSLATLYRSIGRS
ncbi:GntR family transcriptional regulator [Paenibacillus humicola]|uniref:GntR family transcriptional regulator n=1 Tax=Paenibacillus humicola TaxID=3110540 RepID=UPI0030843DC2